MWKHLGKMWKRMMKYGMNNMGYMGMGGKMGKSFPQNVGRSPCHVKSDNSTWKAGILAPWVSKLVD